MQEGGFKLSEADQCMLYKEYEKGVCIIIFYIDDMLIIGKEEAIDDAIRVMFDPERVNAQSHSTIPRLPQIESAGMKELTQPKGMKMLTQQQEKDGKNQGPSHF